MRRRLAVVLLSALFSTSLFGKEVFLSITGKANGFFTDTRIFNPSFTKDITVNAQYLPGNNNNTAAAVVALVIPKRTMKVYDDSVQSMFGGGPALGAIRLTSDDDFTASQRIYLDARGGPQKGTLGQFVPGLELSAARTKGALLQLKHGDASLGSFRTNWGGVNPNTTVANITLRLYDKSNAVVKTKTQQIQPYGMVGPTSVYDFFDKPANDLTDAWVSFESDVAVLLWGSVVDNGSGDPTFIPASEDSGVAPQQPPQTTKNVSVTAVNWNFIVEGTNGLKPGDQVKFTIRAGAGTHGFRLFDPNGVTLIDVQVGSTAIERIVTLPVEGNYQYFCTVADCGAGHLSMNGVFAVGEAKDDPRDGY